MLYTNAFTMVAASATPATTTQGVAGVDEVQALAVDATGGTLTVTYAGQTTAAIDFDASGAAFTTALDALSSLAPGDIVVTGGPGDSGATTPYVLTFGGTLAETPVAEITASGASLTGGAGTATPSTTTAGVAPVNEVQTVTLVGTGGTYTITYSGQTTDPLSPNATAAEITTALEALSNIGVGDVGVTTAGGVVTITFQGALAATPVAEVTATATAMYNATQINDETVDATEFTVHSTVATITIGGAADQCEFLLPEDRPVEVCYSLGEPVYATGTGTIYTLATGCQKTPAR